VIDLKKMFEFDEDFFKQLGKETVKRHVSMVRKGFNNNEEQFSVSAPYQKRYKKDKMAGKYGGDSRYTKGNVNLSLTGKMLDDIKVLEIKEHGFIYGSKTASQAEKINAHAKGIFGKNTNTAKARKISDRKNALPETVGVMILKEMGKEAARNISKEVRKNNLGKVVIQI